MKNLSDKIDDQVYYRVFQFQETQEEDYISIPVLNKITADIGINKEYIFNHNNVIRSNLSKYFK